MTYPHKRIPKNAFINHKNRGMSLENDINLTNEYYLVNNIALIYKKPTPIQTTKVTFNNNKPMIKEAFFKSPSTTDYNGLYKGNYIDFEAKETKNKSSFPLSNIHAHQIKHIKRVIDHHGFSFIIIRFSTLEITYLLNGFDFINYIETNKVKSIPLSYFEEKGFIIKEGYQPRLDYLKIVDILIKE